MGSEVTHVLVVDDQAAIRRLISQTLSNSGLVSLEAASVSQAMALFDLHKDALRLAIIDMVMPPVSGLDLASELIRLVPELKILYISGCVDSVAMDVIARHSPESVLLKPFTQAALMDRVRQLLTDTAPGLH